MIYLSRDGPADYRIFVSSKSFSLLDAAALIVGARGEHHRVEAALALTLSFTLFSSRPATRGSLKHFAMSATHRLPQTGGEPPASVQTAISGSLAMGRTFRIKLRFRRFGRRHPWLTFALRSFMIFSVVFGGAYGFIAGSRAENSGYDPHAFAIGVAFLFAIACVALATFERPAAPDAQEDAQDRAAQ